MLDKAKAEPLSVLAPAKINLYLHVKSRRPDGYHLLDSLVAFADVGDLITISAANTFSFIVDGSFANNFSGLELATGLNSTNLAVRAAHQLSAVLNRPLKCAIRLTKNLPLGAGIGGGSADPAAVIRGLLEWWNITPESVGALQELLLTLGADVPACFYGRAVRMQGIGEILTPMSGMPSLWAVLINPGETCPTPAVFRQFNGGYRDDVAMPNSFKDKNEFIEFLMAQDNMLTPAAESIVPVIDELIEALQVQEGCKFSRLSGSGATCFGIFNDLFFARRAATQLAEQFPSSWLTTTTLN